MTNASKLLLTLRIRAVTRVYGPRGCCPLHRRRRRRCRALQRPGPSYCSRNCKGVLAVV